MVAFSWIEMFQFSDLRHDWVWVKFFLLNFFHNLEGSLTLFLIRIEDGRLVLRSNVITLTILGCWVVDRKENTEQV